MRCTIAAVHVSRPCPTKAEDEACCFEEIVVFKFYSMVFVGRWGLTVAKRRAAMVSLGRGSFMTAELMLAAGAFMRSFFLEMRPGTGRVVVFSMVPMTNSFASKSCLSGIDVGSSCCS